MNFGSLGKVFCACKGFWFIRNVCTSVIALLHMRNITDTKYFYGGGISLLPIR